MLLPGVLGWQLWSLGPGAGQLNSPFYPPSHLSYRKGCGWLEIRSSD